MEFLNVSTIIDNYITVTVYFICAVLNSREKYATD